MDHTITFGSILGIVTVIGATITLLMNARKVRRENEADARAQTIAITNKIDENHKSVDERLRDLEFTVRDFMPRAEIEQRIEHEKVNRVQASNFVKDQLTQVNKDTTDLRVTMARMEARTESVDVVLAETKQTLKDIAADIKALREAQR